MEDTLLSSVPVSGPSVASSREVVPRRRRSEMEFALLTLEPIEDCAVLTQHVSGEELVVAYLVLRGPLARTKIRSHLQDARLAERLPDHYVIVNRLPLTESGELNERALARVSLVDESLDTTPRP